MRINAHAHIFTLQTVLTREAVEIIARRISDRGAPAFVADAVASLLDEQLDRPEYLNEEELLERFLRRVAESETFRRTVRSGTAALPVEIRLLGDGIQGIGRGALRSVLDKLSSAFDDHDVATSGVFDVFETLRMALQPDCLRVADKLLDHLDDDDVIVALMMDITSEREPERDRRNFRAQLDGTAEAAIQRPGRILPFVAVNTRRAEHAVFMKEAVERHGFVGVKLYPSLGFEVDTPAMRSVYDYCVAQELPVLMHCTAGGFYRDHPSQAFCDPAHWHGILRDHPGLRICFGHCGGWVGLAGANGVEPGTWTETIIALMRSHDNVWADLSNHVEMMRGGVAEERYFATVKSLLADPDTADRLLFGTDAWLVRLTLPDAHYWSYFERRLTESEFRRITDDNPRRFFGLPADDGTGMRKNIERHVDFLLRHRDKVGAAPAAWLVSVAGGARFTASRPSPSWTPSNEAHFYTFRFFRDLMTPSDARLGFARAGEVPLRRLTYWNREHEPAALFEQRCAANARKLASFVVVNGATYEGTYDATSAVDRLIAMLKVGDRTLTEAGAMVDAIFLFGSEQV